MAVPLRAAHATSIRLKCLRDSMQLSGVAAALEALSLRGPIHEPLHMVAVFPGEVKKLASRQIGRFFSKERFKAPADVRTLPRPESIAPGCVPVILHCLEHFLRNGRIAQHSSSRLSSPRPPGWKDARERAPSSCRASPKFPCTGGPFP